MTTWLVCTICLLGGYVCDFASLESREWPPLTSTQHRYRLTVETIHTQDAWQRLSEEIVCDRRITADSSSHLQGLSLDPRYNRSQVFAIKNGSEYVGAGTVLATPQQNFHTQKFFKKIENKLVPQTLNELHLVPKTNAYFIEIGYLTLKPEYQGKNIGFSFVTKVLAPFIYSLQEQTSLDLLVFCSAEGCLEFSDRVSFTRALDAYQEGQHIEIPIKNELQEFIGKVDYGARFTPSMALKMGLEPIENIFNNSLGPCFYTVLPGKDLSNTKHLHYKGE